MESSSIVSFNNESTFQNTLKGDNMSVHELALHAMRDRCLLLQRRINVLENDNMKLKLNITKTENKPYAPLEEDEKFEFQQKIAELTKQKSQLMHHVFMVSCENKNLWNKISTSKPPDKTGARELTKAPLVRTNTYIHSTPKSSSNYQEKYSEASLEEISLKLINSYIQEKSQLVEQYEQMTQLHEDIGTLNVDSIGFAYMEDPATDSLKEVLNQTEKLHQLKDELDQQQKDLEFVLSKVEAVLQEGYRCPSCAANSRKVTASEHKEIETSDSLANWATPVESSNYNNSELNTTAFKVDVDTQEAKGESLDKICPMCGKTFPKDMNFNDFQSHVESHFIGEMEPDSIVDNLDNIPTSFDTEH